MASESLIRRCRNWYAKLLRLYPKAHRDRFAEGMEQTFNDLCRERFKMETGLVSFALWIFIETCAAILKQNAISLITCFMKQDSAVSWKSLKYAATAVAALLVAGILLLMVISRGKGEDITGIVAPALLLTIISGVVAIVAAVLQKRAQKPTE